MVILIGTPVTQLGPESTITNIIALYILVPAPHGLLNIITTFLIHTCTQNLRATGQWWAWMRP